MEKKIAILLSTYNGAKYLKQQVKSILQQSNQDWHLYIRDDGSSDTTAAIIRYLAKDSRITFFNEENIKNVGTVQSFMELFEKTDADYYMFSDQDDYWLPNKIKDTLETMLSAEKEFPGKPICVHTNLKVTDDNLKPYRLYNEMPSWDDFQRILFNNCSTGCTMMVNDNLKKMINFAQIDYHKVYMHDWWLTLIAASFGKVCYLEQPTILYRQHASNVLGSLDNGKMRKRLRPLNRIVFPYYDLGEFKKALGMISEFNYEYGDYVFGQNKEYLLKYSSLQNDSSFLHNLGLVIKLPPKETSLKKTLLYSMIMIRFPRKLKNLY